jgi:hypothetical protein
VGSRGAFNSVIPTKAVALGRHFRGDDEEKVRLATISL